MKRQIRRGVFESNSSSTHTLTIMMKEDYDKWLDADGKLYLYDSDFPYEFRDKSEKPEKGKLYSREEAIRFLKIANPDVDYSDYDDEAIACELYDLSFRVPEDDERRNLEPYEATYTTPSGDTIVVFGGYGYE